jgi:hypothetical protein
MNKARQEILESAQTAASAEKVVKVVEHALLARRPRTRYPVGWDARFWLALNLLPDRWRDRLILGRIGG